jgi:Xaa-Pro aminopeptidase
VRNFVAGKGYGEYFVHRTGHSIGTNIHANGCQYGRPRNQRRARDYS